MNWCSSRRVCVPPAVDFEETFGQGELAFSKPRDIMDRHNLVIWTTFSLCTGLFLLLLSFHAWAHTFEAPPVALATAGGLFSYTATFTPGPGGASVAAATVDGTVNTDIGVRVFDFFCVGSFAEGEQVPIDIAGSLLQPAHNGTVTIELATCSGERFEVETTILSPPPEPGQRLGCGDGVVRPGEECDDGNVSDGDCCSSACQLESGSCDDGGPCTTGEQCQNGQCVSSFEGANEIVCRQHELRGEPCEERLPKRLKKAIRKRLKSAHRLLKKADRRAARGALNKVERFRSKALAQLDAISEKTAKYAERITPECKATLDGLVNDRQQEIRGFEFPGKECGGIVGIGCASGQFCELPPGNCCCDFKGTCMSRPKACTREFIPVCGCDGVTYGNDCARRSAGVSKARDGECP